jgi:gliding motility-associated lipoprotein GldH
MKIIIQSVLFMAVMLLLASCGQHSVYNKHVDIENGKWFKDNSAHFEVTVIDTAKRYNYFITIRHNTDYRYSNLYLFLTTQFPDSTYTRDTLECVLADNSGKWFGKGWSNIKEDNILLRQKLKFPMAGKYNFYIQQAMRQDTLKNILSVGINISESK